jgi:hypothetical protein
MNWQSLQEGECPKCEDPLIRSEWGFNCCSCSFKISHDKYETIVSKSGFRDEVEDNLSGLNNL